MLSLLNRFSRTVVIPNESGTEKFRVQVPEGYKAIIDFKHESSFQFTIRPDFSTMGTGFSKKYPQSSEQAQEMIDRAVQDVKDWEAKGDLPIL